MQDPVGPSRLDPAGQGHHGHDGIGRFWDTNFGYVTRFHFLIRDSFANGPRTPAARPAARPPRRDRTARRGARVPGCQALPRIPVGTVGWEETAFGGGLAAAMRRMPPEPAATMAGSAVFGVWHIRPTAEALASAVAARLDAAEWRRRPA